MSRPWFVRWTEVNADEVKIDEANVAALGSWRNGIRLGFVLGVALAALVWAVCR